MRNWQINVLPQLNREVHDLTFNWIFNVLICFLLTCEKVYSFVVFSGLLSCVQTCPRLPHCYIRTGLSVIHFFVIVELIPEKDLIFGMLSFLGNIKNFRHFVQFRWNLKYGCFPVLFLCDYIPVSYSIHDADKKTVLRIRIRDPGYGCFWPRDSGPGFGMEQKSESRIREEHPR